MIDDATYSEDQYPANTKPGCLPRKFNPGELFPMASEKITLIDRADWARLAKDNLQMKPFVKVILDQNGYGSCATESTTGAVMACRAFAGLPHVLLNPLSIYSTTSGGRDSGSSIDVNLDFAQKYGICPELAWPRSNGWRTKPTADAMKAALDFRIEEVYDISTIEEMVSALLTGFCVVYGANGHSVLKVQHLDETQGLDANSWATTWGDKGFGVWAKYRAINWAYGAFAVRSVRQV